MSRFNNQQNDSQSKVIAAIASATDRPFTVAFKATLGVIAAQTLGVVLGLVTIASVIAGVALVISLLK